MVCVFLSVAGGERAARSSLKAPDVLPQLNIKAGEALTSVCLQKTAGSHRFLTRRLGRHYNKMHYGQLSTASVVAVCAREDGHSSRSSSLSPRGDFTAWPVKISAGKIPKTPSVTCVTFQSRSRLEADRSGEQYICILPPETQTKSQLLKGIRSILCLIPRI